MPNFCFVCATIGHAAAVCEEGKRGKEYQFGTNLRASPLKRRQSGRFEILAASPNMGKTGVARPLNFSNSKHAQTGSTASSTGSHRSDKDVADAKPFEEKVMHMGGGGSCYGESGR